MVSARRNEADQEPGRAAWRRGHQRRAGSGRMHSATDRAAERPPPSASNNDAPWTSARRPRRLLHHGAGISSAEHADRPHHGSVNRHGAWDHHVADNVNIMTGHPSRHTEAQFDGATNGEICAGSVPDRDVPGPSSTRTRSCSNAATTSWMRASSCSVPLSSSSAADSAAATAPRRGRGPGPRSRVGEVDADDPAELLGRARPAGGEHFEVAGNDLLPRSS